MNGLIGKSPEIRAVDVLIERIALTTSHVLITGEPGTGKERVARAIHAASARHDRPFVTMDCHTAAGALLERHLFGGGVRPDPGLFSLAEGGTLLLDHVTALPLGSQEKLGRTIEDGQVWPVGGTAPIVVDVRIMMATSADLRREVRHGRFSERLFYRIDAARVEVSPLRRRPADIPLLAEHFVREINATLATSCRGLAADALAVLARHRWPGNVRELRDVVERAVVGMERGHTLISETDVVSALRGHAVSALRGVARPAGGDAAGEGATLRQARRSFARQYIRDVLAEVANDEHEAARRLGVSVSVLRRTLDD